MTSVLIIFKWNILSTEIYLSNKILFSHAFYEYLNFKYQHDKSIIFIIFYSYLFSSFVLKFIEMNKK